MKIALLILIILWNIYTISTNFEQQFEPQKAIIQNHYELIQSLQD